MFNPDKDFNRILLECLGREGMSISALAKDLESKGFKHHRLILTGYLRAMTDMGHLKEREIPPSKIYIVSKTLPDSIYEQVGKACRKVSNDPDELILYTLFRIFRRPVFDSELRSAGVSRPIGVRATEEEIAEFKKILRRAGNTVSGQTAVTPSSDMSERVQEVLITMLLDSTDSRHLIAETKQSKLI
ncbi:MAG: hypothetical protein LBV13_04520 [Methanomassiliicoccaceae archaeon]|jgi:hypothetical protein|nr:hypothetical protein [Methanomassiliicoccaceae archaeon]